MKKTKKIRCDECGADHFKSTVGLQQHKNRMHPYIPPPPPKRERRVSAGNVECFSLINGKSFDVGDVFWHIRKCVFKEITTTEGSADVDVVAEVTKRHYQTNQPK